MHYWNTPQTAKSKTSPTRKSLETDFDDLRGLAGEVTDLLTVL